MARLTGRWSIARVGVVVGGRFLQIALAVDAVVWVLLLLFLLLLVPLPDLDPVLTTLFVLARLLFLLVRCGPVPFLFVLVLPAVILFIGFLVGIDLPSMYDGWTDDMMK